MRSIKITKGKIINLSAMLAFPLFIFFLQFLSFAQVKDMPHNELSTPQKYVDSKELDIAQGLKLEKVVEASYYGKEFHMRRTANGERFNMNDFTAAHRKLPFGSILKVTNLKNGETVLTRVNDRGPFVSGRELDLSYQAAKEIEGLGVAKVRMEGFIPGMTPPTAFEDEEYYYGYSVCDDLVCVPAKAFNAIDTLKGFNGAYNAYKKEIDVNPNKNIFLFVRASQKFNKDRSNSNHTYIIGELKTKALINKNSVIN